jgi:hypothetical protein
MQSEKRGATAVSQSENSQSSHGQRTARDPFDVAVLSAAPDADDPLALLNLRREVV